MENRTFLGQPMGSCLLVLLASSVSIACASTVTDCIRMDAVGDSSGTLKFLSENDQAAAAVLIEFDDKPLQVTSVSEPDLLAELVSIDWNPGLGATDPCTFPE